MVWREGEYMIKLWKGIEKEGIGKDSEIMTLFVCSDCEIPVDLIIETLQANKDIKVIYFGAGRRLFFGIPSEEWKRLIAHCKAVGISIVMEVNHDRVYAYTYLYNSEIVTFVVAYYNAPKNINRLYFKTDDFETTKIFVSQKDVDITCVSDNMYPDDVILYEED